jgi:hypothetical protein
MKMFPGLNSFNYFFSLREFYMYFIKVRKLEQKKLINLNLVLLLLTRSISRNSGRRMRKGTKILLNSHAATDAVRETNNI